MTENWYDDRNNLADLWRWLEENGNALDDPAYFLEKPWKWTPEWEEFIERQSDSYHPGTNDA